MSLTLHRRKQRLSDLARNTQLGCGRAETGSQAVWIQSLVSVRTVLSRVGRLPGHAVGCSQRMLELVFLGRFSPNI